MLGVEILDESPSVAECAQGVIIIAQLKPQTFSCLKRQEGQGPTRAKSIVQEYQDVFGDMPPGLPPLRIIGHTIDTGSYRPVSKQAYKLSPKEKDEVQRQVRELLGKGLIRPSQSPCGAPVLFVQKKDLPSGSKTSRTHIQ